MLTASNLTAMPWCESCEKNWTPSSVKTDGTCPDCGAPVEGTPGVEHQPEPYKTPWHFWVGVGAAGIYLVWRAIEGLLLLF